MIRKSLLVFAFLTITSSLQAQETELESEGLVQAELTQLEVSESSLQMSEAITSGKGIDGASELIAMAPFTEMAPGVCLVISDMLAGFCVSNPNDTSCQSQ